MNQWWWSSHNFKKDDPQGREEEARKVLKKIRKDEEEVTCQVLFDKIIVNTIIVSKIRKRGRRWEKPSSHQSGIIYYMLVQDSLEMWSMMAMNTFINIIPLSWMKQIFFWEVEHEVVAIKEGLEAEGKSVGVLKVTKYLYYGILNVITKSAFLRSLQNQGLKGHFKITIMGVEDTLVMLKITSSLIMMLMIHILLRHCYAEW